MNEPGHLAAIRDSYDAAAADYLQRVVHRVSACPQRVFLTGPHGAGQRR